MTDEQWEAIKKFIRAYSRLQIDNMILSAMLFKYQSHQTPPTDWYSEMKQMRELPLHRASRQELAALIADIEQDRRDSELIRLLNSLPKLRQDSSDPPGDSGDGCGGNRPAVVD